MNKQNYNNNTYRLVAILDRQGNRRAETDLRRKEFYSKLEGCIARNIRKDTSLYIEGEIVRVDVVQDPFGKWINRNFRTSPVDEIREQDDGSLEIVTKRSIYRFELEEMIPPVYLDEADVIEMYLNNDNAQFCNGFYYDYEKYPHQLGYVVHVGMFQDSVLIRREDSLMGEFVCRYFPRNSRVTFYDTIYRQQDYATPMVIHNTGEIPLKIEFAGFCAKWTILPGESKSIQPFCADGADPGSTEKSKRE